MLRSQTVPGSAISALSPTSWITLVKILTLSLPKFMWNVGVMIIPTSRYCCEDLMS